MDSLIRSTSFELQKTRQPLVDQKEKRLFKALQTSSESLMPDLSRVHLILFFKIYKLFGYTSQIMSLRGKRKLL